MKIEKILLSTRFKELKLNFLEPLLKLKKTGLKQIILLFVIPEEDVGFVPYGGFLKDEEKKMRKIAEANFGEWKKRIISKGIDCKIRIEIGDLVQKTISIAEDEKVDIITIGKRKRNLFGKFNVISQNLVDLVRCSTVPVLVSKYIEKYKYKGESITKLNNPVLNNPLIATDWSEPSKKSLDIISSMSPVINKVCICHVLEDKILKGLSNADIKHIKEESIKGLNEYSDILKKSKIKSEIKLLFGKPAREIINLAIEEKASMIVMGTTGKDLFKEMWFGSVSYRIMESSELPVLMIP